jgi:transcriptional regulator with GAF, ATPase, and Fis domain
MATLSSWVREESAVNSTPLFQIDDGTSARVSLDNNELWGSELPNIIGDSAALRRVLAMVRVAAPTDATILINGETGTGKELIAEAIHRCSDRSNGPFVKVSCAAIPAGLLESELFGHERGAYTGAIARGIGRFERANRGTLFLDEIGDLPLELQPKLLRVMQERQFERLGGTATIHTDVRVISATHRNLLEMVEERQFRADLFYRLSVFPIHIPSLRDRCEDIRSLVHHFARNYATKIRKTITDVSDEFMAALEQHSWPGNVRELQNFIERSVILSAGAVLTGPSPEFIDRTPKGSKGSESFTSVTLEQLEHSHILQTLQQTEGVIGGRNGAAARLGLPRTALIHKMKRLGVSLASILISEDPILVDPGLNGVSQNSAHSESLEPRSDTGRVCTLAEAEREYISEVLEMTTGLIAGKGGAADLLGLPPSTLRNRMKRLGIRF